MVFFTLLLLYELFVVIFLIFFYNCQGFFVFVLKVNIVKDLVFLEYKNYLNLEVPLFPGCCYLDFMKKTEEWCRVVRLFKFKVDVTSVNFGVQ